MVRRWLVALVAVAVFTPMAPAGAEAGDVCASAIGSQRLVSPSSSDGDLYGQAVAVSGDTVAVGSVGEQVVYVYVRSGSGWVLQAALPNRNGGHPGDRYGGVLALDGDTLAVAAPARDTGRFSLESGVVFIYERTGTRWALAALIRGREEGALRGSALALHNGSLLVGVPGSGGFYAYDKIDVWTRGDAAWSQTDTLRDPVPDGPGGVFGLQFDASEGRAVIQSDTGALAYERLGQTWTYQAPVRDSQPGQVEVAGRTMLINGPGVNAAGPGYVQVFRRTGANVWTLQQTLTAPPGLTDADDFGASAAIGEDFLAVGAPHYDLGSPNTSNGRVVMYTRQAGSWSPKYVVSPAQSVPGDLYGIAVAADGATAVVGAPDEELSGSSPGAVYVYT